jgi:hypothetical protein
MKGRPGPRAVALSMLLLASLGLLIACGEPRAEPIEVTYYYLPG